MKSRPCKDCVAQGVLTGRPAPYPGPRCLTHHRLEKKRKSKAAHARRTEANFEITGDDYDLLYASQGGRCFICQWATGRTKRLAVDHDHHKCDHHAPEKGCRACIRALLCSRCNVQIGFWGIESLQRAIEVLTDPPAQKILKGMVEGEA